MSYRDKQTIPLRDQGIVRIEGQNLDSCSSDSNMSGKSALIEAIVWCLFGKTVRGLKHDAVIFRHWRHGCFVKFRFQKSEHSAVYSVIRQRGKHNGLQLLADRRDISHRHEAATQKSIEAALGCDYTTFTNSVLFGGVRAFASLSDADQKKVLESFLHFEQIDIALKNTRRLLAQSEERLSELRLEVEQERGNATAARKELGACRRAEKEFLETKSKRVKEYEDKIRSARKKLKGLQGSVLRKRQLEEDLAESSLVQQELQFRCATKQSEIAQALKNLRKLKAVLKNRKALRGKPCPTCGSLIKKLPASLDHIRNEISEEKDRMRAAKKRVSSLQRRTEYGQEDLKSLEKKIRILGGDISRESAWRERVALWEHEADKARSLISVFEHDISRLSLRYSRAVSKCLARECEMSRLEKKTKGLQFWEEGFGNRGIKAVIVRDALPVLNGKLSEYAGEIFGNTAKLKFSPTTQTKSGDERELFHVSYIAKRGAGNYLGGSAGERRRVDICVLLALAWYSRTCSLLLVDELLDNLDESGREVVLGILSALRGTVLVISHRKELRAKIGKVWTVTKENGRSSIDLGEEAA